MRTALVVGLVLSLVGCNWLSGDVAQIGAANSPHHVTLYGSNGTVIKDWHSVGNVKNESQSDGWYFQDAATHKLIEVTGTIVIEQE